MPPRPSVSRRGFLGKAFLAAATAPVFLNGQTSDAPPNILVVTSDQMRGDALGALGHPNVRTPNLDRMAREGVLFENCFANGPVCVPTRKSCFSGLYPHQHGNLTNDERPLLGWNGSMLEHFAARGYRTGWVGKNHTFEREAVKNLAFASIRDREPFRAYNGMVPPHWHTAVYWHEEDCYPAVNTNAALNFIDQAKAGEPFFLHVSYFDPHPPYMAPAEYTSRYRPEDMRLPEYIAPELLSERLAAFKHAMGLNGITRADLARSLEWKMIVNENRGPELYKMNGGWVERENVAGRREFAPVREAMEKRLRQWWTW